MVIMQLDGIVGTPTIVPVIVECGAHQALFGIPLGQRDETVVYPITITNRSKWARKLHDVFLDIPLNFCMQSIHRTIDHWNAEIRNRYPGTSLNMTLVPDTGQYQHCCIVSNAGAELE